MTLSIQKAVRKDRSGGTEMPRQASKCAKRHFSASPLAGQDRLTQADHWRADLRELEKCDERIDLNQAPGRVNRGPRNADRRVLGTWWEKIWSGPMAWLVLRQFPPCSATDRQRPPASPSHTPMLRCDPISPLAEGTEPPDADLWGRVQQHELERTAP